MNPAFCSTIDSPIGLIKIFADEEFVTEITFSDKDANGLSENTLSKTAALQLESYFKGDLKEFSFPMKQKGTEFQQEVWKALKAIDYANTVSYAQFSAHNPLAIRAIAAANGKNNLAVVIPCHRVIGSDGKLVGYAGGLWRKKWLLQHEREVAQKGQTELKF
ncbi:MAG: methylated-DNA--[protein]-cysteine S-methyltransferase [Bacteroidota bacterium]